MLGVDAFRVLILSWIYWLLSRGGGHTKHLLALPHQLRRASASPLWGYRSLEQAYGFMCLLEGTGSAPVWRAPANWTWWSQLISSLSIGQASRAVLMMVKNWIGTDTSQSCNHKSGCLITDPGDAWVGFTAALFPWAGRWVSFTDLSLILIIWTKLMWSFLIDWR